MWKDCGDLAIFLGLESVTDEGLKAVNKKNTADNNVQAINILKDLGVGFTPNFIVDPAWDRDDFKRLRDWIETMGAYNSGFSILTPLPGTDLWDTAKQNVNTHEWEMFDIVHTVLPTKLPLDEFYAEYSALWQHALNVRYRYKGKLKTYLQLGAALATRKVTLKAVRSGMNIAKVFSQAGDVPQSASSQPCGLGTIATTWRGSITPASREFARSRRHVRRASRCCVNAHRRGLVVDVGCGSGVLGARADGRRLRRPRHRRLAGDDRARAHDRAGRAIRGRDIRPTPSCQPCDAIVAMGEVLNYGTLDEVPRFVHNAARALARRRSAVRRRRARLVSARTTSGASAATTGR